ncbi:hypothetical protein D3C75_473000 [compost metagenome]
MLGQFFLVSGAKMQPVATRKKLHFRHLNQAYRRIWGRLNIRFQCPQIGHIGHRVRQTHIQQLLNA